MGVVTRYGHLKVDRRGAGRRGPVPRGDRRDRQYRPGARLHALRDPDRRPGPYDPALVLAPAASWSESSRTRAGPADQGRGRTFSPVAPRRCSGKGRRARLSLVIRPGIDRRGRRSTAGIPGSGMRYGRPELHDGVKPTLARPRQTRPPGMDPHRLQRRAKASNSAKNSQRSITMPSARYARPARQAAVAARRHEQRRQGQQAGTRPAIQARSAAAAHACGRPRSPSPEQVVVLGVRRLDHPHPADFAEPGRARRRCGADACDQAPVGALRPARRAIAAARARRRRRGAPRTRLQQMQQQRPSSARGRGRSARSSGWCHCAIGFSEA